MVKKSHGEESLPISNTDIEVIKSNSNKEIAKQVLHEIPLVLKEFEVVNKACGSFYGNKTQRGAIEKLITTYGYETVMRVVTILPKLNRALYNKATTPVELWNKWAKIEAEASQLKNKSKQSKYAITTTY